MPDWTKPMERSYEYYEVEPRSLADIKKLYTIRSASFTRDIETETLGSASFEAENLLGESYIRGYLKTVQNGITEKFPLGTYLVQTPSSSFNGKVRTTTMDAYSPLIELKENKPPLGYTIRKGTNIMERACSLIHENCRIPFSKVSSTKELQYNFVSNTDDTWLTFITDLIKCANYELGLDETGMILFNPKQELESLQPVWTYNDDNSSILYPEITMDHDLFGIPNRVEVIYSYGGTKIEAAAENNDPNSPTSITNRGRKITVRDTSPSLAGYNSQEQVEEYAERLLKELSTVEYTVSYKHAYCPVRVGDCVRLNYTKAGISGIKAKVISQNFSSDLACPVSETAVFTQKLWR